MIELSYSEAINIQRAQLFAYKKALGRKGIKIIRTKTKKCPDGIHPNNPISVYLINELIPRGGDLERYFYGYNYSKHTDETNLYYYKAMIKGYL